VGITAHWIRVTKSGEWKLEGNVIALRGLVGEHGGKNLGRYVAGLCDRVGITGFENSKVSNHVITANHEDRSHHRPCSTVFGCKSCMA
jgi:hypothetical protein